MFPHLFASRTLWSLPQFAASPLNCLTPVQRYLMTHSCGIPERRLMRKYRCQQTSFCQVHLPGGAPFLILYVNCQLQFKGVKTRRFFNTVLSLLPVCQRCSTWFKDYFCRFHTGPHFDPLSHDPPIYIATYIASLEIFVTAAAHGRTNFKPKHFPQLHSFNFQNIETQSHNEESTAR